MSDGSIMRSAAIVCGEVATRSAPILYAARSESVDEADSGWQFLCGAGNEDIRAAQIWAVHEVLEIDQSLAPYIGFPAGTVLQRESPDNEWEVTVGPEECRP